MLAAHWPVAPPDSRVPHRMNLNNFSHPQTFPLAPPAGQHLWFRAKYLNAIKWIAMTFVIHIYVPHRQI